jgi:demethylmenaquinone methyltransferase / 2-methoxy-6-polyprenyl-1,4-benzoquinol methylase
MKMTEIQGATKELDGGDGEFFDGIAERYDLLNRILSLGLDGRWRRRAVEALDLGDAKKILDVATGTADLAIAIAEANEKVEVVGVDPRVEMLANGRPKLGKLASRVTLEEGDGQNLRFEDNQFDGACVAFGIRNFPDRLKGLREMARVVRAGRPVVILELSEPRRGLMAGMSRLYVHQVVPRVGALLSGSEEYRYLQESIAAFPPAEDFCAMMGEAGLENVTVTPLTFGVVNLFVGTATS